jgi:hypothetical protein
LYPADSALAAQLTHGILSTVATFDDTDLVSAQKIQAKLVASHCTSLRGAIPRGIDPHEFLPFERRMDYSILRPNPMPAAAVAHFPAELKSCRSRWGSPRAGGLPFEIGGCPSRWRVALRGGGLPPGNLRGQPTS